VSDSAITKKNKHKVKMNSLMLTPVFAVKGQTEQEKQRNNTVDDLFSKAVSSIRKPIGGFKLADRKTTGQLANRQCSACISYEIVPFPIFLYF
jgi:hypothetical protein